MKRYILAFLLLFCLGVSTSFAQSDAPKELMPTENIRPGMKGYGLTVFEGTKIERFELRVIGVINGFLPKQDIILIEALDPRIVHSGIVAGMSGSPIYIEGKLAGALSYGWGFGKDPIAGVTPIQSMLDLSKIPTRGVDSVTKKQIAEAPQREAVEVGPYTLYPVSTPLSVSGMGAHASKTLAELFAPYGVEVMPMMGGASPSSGGGKATYYKDLDVKFEPGSAIGVTLMSGDISVTGTGTVTYVDGNKVYAFGHPMLNMGETYFPMNTAWIHMILASVQRSFKMSSPIREVGSLVQDRQAAIYGDITKQAPMIPYTLKIEDTEKKTSQTFQMQVIRHPLFTSSLVRSAVDDALDSFSQDVAPVAYTLESKFTFEGYSPVVITDQLYSGNGINRFGLDAAESFRALGDILNNPFGPIAPSAVEITVRARYETDYLIVKGAQLQGTEVNPGDRVNLYVTVARFGQPDEVLSIPVEIPEEAAGQPLDVVVDTGSKVRPEIATPEDIRGMLESYSKRFSPRSLVVTLQLPTKGVNFKGQLVSGLPESVLDSLNPSATTEKARVFKASKRFFLDVPELPFGRASVRVSVLAKKS